MMQNVTLRDYKPKRGATTKLRSKVQLAGYQPTTKRIGDLLAAGLIRQAAADEWYDSQFDYTGIDDLPPIPPINRAFKPDFADIAEVASELSQRRDVINERVRLAAEAGKLTLKPSLNNQASQQNASESSPEGPRGPSVDNPRA